MRIFNLLTLFLSDVISVTVVNSDSDYIKTFVLEVLSFIYIYKNETRFPWSRHQA